jgi:hypothetical protein
MATPKEEIIRDFPSLKILGYVRTQANGDKIAFNFQKRILGYYRAKYDHTTDWTGRIIAKGDTVVSLIYQNK